MSVEKSKAAVRRFCDEFARAERKLVLVLGLRAY